MIHSRVPGRRLLLGLAMAVVAVAAATTATAAVGTATATPLKFAILSDCGGAFAANYQQDIGGAISAVSQFGGARPKNKNKPSDGWVGGSIGGHPLNIVGIGCANETAALALKETRRLMVQLGGDVMIGPLSGDEAVSIANWAKQNPTKTRDHRHGRRVGPRRCSRAKNLFRYHGDGAQWNAGLGEIVYKKLGWRTAALIGDDYSFPWTSGAGIIADFCGIGGKITKRVWTPPAGGDYASFIRQLPAPDKVDGYFWRSEVRTRALRSLRSSRPTGRSTRSRLGQPVPVLPGCEHDGGSTPRRRVHGRLRHVPDGRVEDQAGTHLREERGQVVQRVPRAGKASNAADGFFYNYYATPRRSSRV